MDDEKYMSLAIEKAKEGIKSGQTPFAACIVRDGKVLACEHNHVWRDTDVTAHAEITALRSACKEIKGIDLTGATVYSTTEPCPMCFSAIHWSKADRIVYGAKIADAKKAGFNELTVSNFDLKELGESDIEIDSGCLKEECADLFRLWKETGASELY